jgi:hypothetical protein
MAGRKGIGVTEAERQISVSIAFSQTKQNIRLFSFITLGTAL